MHFLHRAFFLKKPDRISHISMLLILTLLFILFSNNNVTLFVTGGGKESRTPDPLLARQVLSQLSYTPIFAKFKLDFGGLKWTRTTDLTLIRRVL